MSVRFPTDLIAKSTGLKNEDKLLLGDSDVGDIAKYILLSVLRSYLNFVDNDNVAVDNNIALFDGATGKKIKDSLIKIATEINDTNTEIPTSDILISYIAQEILAKTKFGDVGAGNYSEFEEDGTLKMNGGAVVYNDIQYSISTGRGGSVNHPEWTTFVGNLSEYTFAIGDYIDLGSQELPHSYKDGTDLEIHLHYATNGVNITDRVVGWEVEYSLANRNQAFPTPVVVSADSTITANTADRTQKYVSIGIISGASLAFGAQLKMRLRRIATTGTAPTANPFALQIGVHYVTDTIGSRTISDK